MRRLVLFGVLVAKALSESEGLFDLDDTDESRQFFLPIVVGGAGNALALNVTQLAALASLLASGLMSLLGLTALGMLLYSLLTTSGGTGYSDTGNGGGGGGYSSSYSSYRRSFNPYAIDWEKFSILDWIAIGEEAWKKFDPADLSCQKRLICEIHQNTAEFGPAAKKMVDLFSYVQYAQVMSIPDEVKTLIEEYLDAADRGKTKEMDCGKVFSNCEFSVKSLIDRYAHNEV